MSTNTTAPGLADRLCSLAEHQLQMQAARSTALEWDTRVNGRALNRKEALFKLSLNLLTLAVVVELAGVIR